MILLVSAGAFAAGGGSLLTGNFGVNFFGYKTTYLTTGIVYQRELRPGMDMVGGADFGIHTEQGSSGETLADFLIPFKLGIEFPFSGTNTVLSFGTGLSPCFQFTHDSNDASFLMGPYVTGTARVKVHPVMSVFLQVQQDLLFGKPDWIYTGTRLAVGVSF